jgi:hypothetical protein
VFSEWKNNWHNQAKGASISTTIRTTLLLNLNCSRTSCLPVNEVYPYLVAIVPTGEPSHKEIEDKNRATRVIKRVPESEHGLCPGSDDENGDDLNLTEEHDCYQTISYADPLDDITWIWRKQGNFAFMDQDAYGRDIPPFQCARVLRAITPETSCV